MKKTSVYLDDADVARLRELQRITGKSRAELLREGIRVLAGEEPERPRLKFVGAGSWPVTAKTRRWTADELANKRGAR